MNHRVQQIWLITIAIVALLVGGAAARAQTGIPDFTQLVEQHSAAVVSINAEPGEPALGGGPGAAPQLPFPEDSPLFEYFRRFFEELPDVPPPGRGQLAMGSGFIISTDGYILTNAHVVRGAGAITVGLHDRRQLSAKLIGQDPRSDVALLKVEAKDLPAVNIGDPNQLKVGQWVLAIGSPFGFEHSATQGIISALGRSLPTDTYVPFIQTDAAVNPGNSGGPLFNLDGEVIGINAQIYSRTGGYMGVSFAIPIDVAMDVAEQLKATGKVSRGWLGVLIQEVTAELAESFGLEQPHGALVGQVLADSPAQQAGLQPGDVIVGFNKQPIEHSSDLPLLVGRTRPGSTVPLTVIRDGKEQTLEVTIEELPEDPQRQAAVEPTRDRLGLVVSDLPPEQRRTTEDGVLVSKVGEGPAARAGIQPGDIILRLNNQPVTDAAQFRELVKGLPTGRPLPVLVQRGEGAIFLAITIPEK